MLTTLTVSDAKSHLNQLVRELDASAQAVLIRNHRTNQWVILMAARPWQQELEQLLGSAFFMKD
ncbi:hypothetical protein [Loigolactobacillus rennini]|nr:hypothetical protein [Loigolactobacillus rennini]SFZ89065.1 hypothetical protein LREN565_2178 [Loigolactobacillus rennini]